jgi:hypothetical protein
VTQQNANYSEDNTYKRKLFYDNGIRYVEVKARHINEYKPPTPVVKTHVNQNLQGPAGLVSQGTSHYESSLTLLFYSKADYASWLQFIGATQRYYDEKGTIYYGIITGTPDIRTAEFETKYIITVSLSLIRKQDFDYRQQAPFTDTAGHWAEKYIDEMQLRGLVTVYDQDGTEVQLFRPDGILARAEATALMVRSYRYIDKLLRGY